MNPQPLQPIPVTYAAPPQQSTQQTLQQIVYFLWRRWAFVLTVTALAFLAAEAWLALQTPLYRASTQIMFDPAAAKMAAGDTSFYNTINMDNQVAIAQSSALLRQVVEKERLYDDPEFGSKAVERASQAVGAKLARTAEAAGAEARAVSARLDPFGRKDEALGRAGDPSGESASGDGAEQAGPTEPEASGASAARINATVAAFARAVTARRSRTEADVFTISVTAADSARAARLANAVAATYLLDPLNARLEAGLRESGWLSQRLPALRERLRASEEAVVAFRAQHNLVDGKQNVTLNQEQVDQLNARLVAARADVAEKKAKVDLLQSLEARGGDAEGLPETMNTGLLASLRTELDQNSLRVAGLAARLGDGNPEVIKARAERADIKRAIAAALRSIAQNVRNQYSLALAQEQAIEKILRDVTGQTNSADKTAIQLHELEEEASVNRRMFEDFLKRISVINELSGDQARLGRVLVAATPPSTPSFPRKGLTLGAALIAGLALGLGGAWAGERLSPGFNTSREAEEALGLPLLVSIARTDETQVALPRHVRLNPLSRLSEAARTLRASIQMTANEQPPKVVQVTSALPGEGKTTTSLMVASSFSGSGLKTLVIDADLRSPSVSRYFGLQKEAGVADLLLNQANAERVIHFNEPHGLWVLPAGAVGRGSGDLMTFDRVRKLIDRYRQNFDCIIVDTPPVGHVVDARVIASLVDKVVFVVKWRTTSREMVRETIKLLPDQGKMAGIVFNFVDESLAKRYGDSRYFSS